VLAPEGLVELLEGEGREGTAEEDAEDRLLEGFHDAGEVSESPGPLPWLFGTIRRSRGTVSEDSSCVFCKIARGELPAEIVWEDEGVLAFRDLHPRAPEHVLLIPRKHIGSIDHLDDADAAVAGKLLLAARDIARQLGLSARGYRLVANTGADGGQSVDHLHFHLLGGRSLGWPPG
jgi:histidine triad (HIT) family protein